MLETRLKSTLTLCGMYSIIGLTSAGPSSAHLTFEKDGYEASEIDAPRNTFSEIALQRIIRLRAGETVTPSQLAPHDLSYNVGADRCDPCRLIRVVNPTPGMLQLRLTWTEPRATLNLWVAGRRVDGTYPEAVADLPVSAGEVVVFVGMMPAPAETSRLYVPFTVATIRPNRSPAPSCSPRQRGRPRHPAVSSSRGERRQSRRRFVIGSVPSLTLATGRPSGHLGDPVRIHRLRSNRHRGGAYFRPHLTGAVFQDVEWTVESNSATTRRKSSSICPSSIIWTAPESGSSSCAAPG